MLHSYLFVICFPTFLCFCQFLLCIIFHQCYLGRKSLDAQLQEMGVFSSSDYISMYPEINEDFKICMILNKVCNYQGLFNIKYGIIHLPHIYSFMFQCGLTMVTTSV